MFSENITADGQTAVISIEEGEQKVYMYGAGTWGSGTLKLQVNPLPTGTGDWIDVASGSITADGYVAVNVNGGRIRCDLSGASSPDLDVYVSVLNTTTSAANS